MKRLLLVVLLAGGCGASVPVTPPSAALPGASGAPASASVASAAASAVAPKPTPGPMTVAYAARVYLAVASRSNKIGDAAWAKLPKNPTLRQWHAYFTTVAADSRDFADRLKSRIWPPEAAADMKLLLRAIAREGLYELELSKENDVASFNSLYATWRKVVLDGSSLANAVRTDLGLKPVPVD